MPVKHITSASNEVYKHVKKLLAQRGYRHQCAQFVVEGRRLAEDMLLSGIVPQAVLLAQGLCEGEAARWQALCQTVYVLPDNLLCALGDTKTPQGILALCPLPEPQAFEAVEAGGAPPAAGNGREVSLLLCSLQDPGNVGTIIRTAEALGAARVLLSADCPDIYSPKLLRATMGGVFRLPVGVVEDAPGAIAALRRSGVRVYAAALREGAGELGQMDPGPRACAVIGNEGAGLPEDIISLCSGAVRIPMRGRAQSLNAAMAAGVLLWEWTKR